MSALGSYYGSIQLEGTGFYALLKFVKAGPLPAPTAPIEAGTQRIYASLDFQQMPVMVDMLRHERPVRFGWNDSTPIAFHLMTGDEPTGEGES
jgi:hypothetical protein